jgi:hypothetical protein
MQSNHKKSIGERYISYIMKQALRYPSAHLVALLCAVVLGVATFLRFSKAEIPFSSIFVIMFLSWALLWYERLQFTRMILERDNKIADFSKD